MTNRSEHSHTPPSSRRARRLPEQVRRALPRPQRWVPLLVAALFLIFSSLPFSILHLQSLPPTEHLAEAAGRGNFDLPPMSKPVKGQAKLDSALAELASTEQQAGPGAAADLAVRGGVDLKNGLVQVIVQVQPGQAEAARREAEGSGGRAEASYGDLLQLQVPPNALKRLAALPTVRSIRRPQRSVSTAITGQEVQLSGANTWHTAGMTGAGVKIAIIDLGFANYTAHLGSELPSTVITRSFRADGDLTGGGEVHGTAVAEIVHEMAPDAQLYLVNFNTEVEFGNAVDYAIAQGAQIVSHSTGSFLSGPGDGTGLLNTAVTRAVQSGISWAQSAGNYAQQHWAGAWQDTDADDWLNFSGNNEINDFTVSVAAGTFLMAELRWDDPFGASCNDFDLYLIGPEGTIVAGSENWQDCTQDPTEAVYYVTPTAGYYGFSVSQYSASRAVNFDLFALPFNLVHSVTAGSLSIPADNPNVMTAGAINWSTPTSIESFSSRGPTRDGRIKPDIAGIDRVSNATYGSFAGTSAAAPHVAGAAALVKQANPGYTPAQIKSFLESRAVDLGAAGKDNTFGAGRLNLGASPGPPGVLQFSAAGYSAGENEGNALVIVARTGGSAGAVAVTAATTAGGSAAAGADYAAATTTLTWADGDAAPQTFAIPIVDDTLVETHETVNLVLSNPTGGATLGAQSTAVLTILDNEKTLTFTSEPLKGSHSAALGRQPVVTVIQGGGTALTDSSTVVTLGIKPGTGAPGATLSCSGGLARAASSGVATFAGCQINRKGGDYVLEATASGATTAQTQPFVVTWAGDVNGDCLVDIVDFSALRRGLGKQADNAGYDPRADLNGDDRSDTLDFSVLVTGFGTRCPP